MTIKKLPIQWLYDYCAGSKELFESNIFKKLLIDGAYIAGGLIRKLIRDKSTDGLIAYFENGGDIDIFVNDYLTFNVCKNMRTQWRDSLGKNALNSNVHINAPFTVDTPIYCKLQLISKLFAPPEEMLETFDLVNSQFAADRESFWFNPEALILENDQTLQALRQGDLLGVRIVKYFKKYDYDRLEEGTKNLLLEWIENSNKISWIPMGVDRKVMNPRGMLASLIKSGLVSDSDLVNIAKSYRTSVTYFEYSNFSELPKRTIQADVSDLAINMSRTTELAPGDLIELIPFENNGLLWTSCLALKRKGGIDDIWLVMGPRGLIAAMPRCVFKSVRKQCQ